jgi:hypothetical protein
LRVRPGPQTGAMVFLAIALIGAIPVLLALLARLERWATG